MVTDAVGPVQIEVPRDREGTIAPVIVAKRQRRRGSASLQTGARLVASGRPRAP